LEAAEAKAILEDDLPALNKLLGEAYTVNAPDNKIRDRKGVAEAIKAGIIKYSSFERKVEKVLLHGDTAVVMGGETVKHLGGPDDGRAAVHRRVDEEGRTMGDACSARECDVSQVGEPSTNHSLQETPAAYWFRVVQQFFSGRRC
jgi:hypothetical protein